MDHFGGRNGRETPAEPLTTALRIPARHSSRAALVPAACLAASLFLAGCSGATTTERETAAGESSAAEDSGTTPGTETSNSGTESSDSSPESSDSSPESSESSTESDSDAEGPSEAASGEATSAPDPTAGSLSGSFANLGQACQTISSHMLSVAFAPLSYSYGGGRAEAKEAVGKLPELREKVPPELRDDVANVKQVFDDSGPGYSDFDEAAFKDAVLPIEDWVTENCPEL